VAVRLPVAPVAATLTSAAELAPSVVPSTLTSKRSVMPDGGLKVRSLASANRPTRVVSATVVVIDGATTLVELALA